MRICIFCASLLASLLYLPVSAQTSATSKPNNPQFDAELAKQLGADQRGMRQYVLVILKTGPNRVPDGETRKAMFAGHFANIKRLSEEGKLVLVGPLDGVDGWRGLFIFALSEIEEAKKLTETDPVIVQGEMVAEYHRWYGSAAVMAIPSTHAKISAQTF